MTKRMKPVFLSVLFSLCLVPAWVHGAFAADDPFRVSAYYVEGETELSDGEKKTIAFSWQGGTAPLTEYAYKLYEGRCGDEEGCAEAPVIESKTTPLKRFEIDSETCPGWDCTLEVSFQGVSEEALPGEAGGEPVQPVYRDYASPEKFVPTLPIIVVETDDRIPVCEGIKTLGISSAEKIYEIDGCYEELDCSVTIKAPVYLGGNFLSMRKEYSGDSDEITINGNSSRSFPKRQYGIEIDLDDGKTLFGMRRDDDWRLNGSWLDRSFIRNKLAYDLFNRLNPGNNFGAQTRYAELFINGEYRGIYILTEKVGRTRTSTLFPGLTASGGMRDGGFLVDISRAGIDKRGIYDFLDQEYPFFCPDLRSVAWNTAFYALDYPKDDDLSMFRELDVVRFLSSFHKAAVSETFSDPATGIFSFLDRDSALDFILVHELSKNNDAYFGNFKMLRPRNEKLRLIIWDMDLAFGNRSNNNNEDRDLYEGFTQRPQMFYRIQRADGFHGDLTARWGAIRADKSLLGDLATVEKEIECLTGAPCSDAARTSHDGWVLSSDALERNFARWPYKDKAYELISEADNNNFDLMEAVNFPSEVEAFKVWMKNRMAYLDDDTNWAKLLRRAELRKEQTVPCN